MAKLSQKAPYVQWTVKPKVLLQLMACQFIEGCRGVRWDLRKFKAACDELSGAAIEDCETKYRLEGSNAAFRVGMRETGNR